MLLDTIKQLAHQLQKSMTKDINTNGENSNSNSGNNEQTGRSKSHESRTFDIVNMFAMNEGLESYRVSKTAYNSSRGALLFYSYGCHLGRSLL